MQTRMASALKDTLVRGASRAFAALDRRGSLRVVTFHRFGGATGLDLPRIRQQLEFARRWRVIAPGTVDWNAGMPTGTAMITVDDSHGDIYTHLYPVALELRVPFVICVPTDYFFRRRWLWFDRLYWMVEHCGERSQVDLEGTVRDLRHVDDLAIVKVSLKRMLPEPRESWLDSFARDLRLPVPDEPVDGYEPVTIPQMREMLDSGLVEISGHTVTHTIATVLPPQRLAEELRASRRELEEFSGRPLTTFCYPNGLAGDFDAATAAVVEAAGFTCAFTSVPGINPAATDRYSIRRVHSHRSSAAFEAALSGLADMRGRLRFAPA